MEKTHIGLLQVSFTTQWKLAKHITRLHQIKENLINTANDRNEYKDNLHHELSSKDFSMIMVNMFKKKETWGMGR